MPTTSDHDDVHERPDRPDGEDRVIGRPYSRVESEVMEILRRSDKPISFTEHVRRKTARARRERLLEVGTRVRRSQGQAGPGTFLLACIGLALAAFLLRDASRLLATLLAVASVVCLFWPVVTRLRQPSAPTTKRWRGRDMDYTTPAEPPRWARDLRDRFRKR